MIVQVTSVSIGRTNDDERTTHKATPRSDED